MPSFRRPIACQRSSGVIPVLTWPPRRPAASAAAPHADAQALRTPSASVSRADATTSSSATSPHRFLDDALGMLAEHFLDRREPLVTHVAGVPEVALLLDLTAWQLHPP